MFSWLVEYMTQAWETYKIGNSSYRIKVLELCVIRLSQQIGYLEKSITYRDQLECAQYKTKNYTLP